MPGKCFSSAEIHLSGQPRMSPARIESILTSVKRVREGRSLTVKQFQKLSNVIPVHETSTVVAQDQGVLPEGKSTLHDQGHATMSTCLRHVTQVTNASLTGCGVVMSLAHHLN